MSDITHINLDEPLKLELVEWQGRISCAYLNDFRIVGGKPWGGAPVTKKFTLTLKDIVRAIPALQAALRVDYLGNPIAPPSDNSDAQAGGIGIK